MFNQEVKNLFLEYVKDESTKRNSSRFTDESKVIEAVNNTVTAYKGIFKSSQPIEEKYNVDLSSFNLKQVSELMTYRKPKTKTSARTIGRIITKYIDWSILNKKSTYINISDNPLRISQDYFSQFVPSEDTQYLSIDNILDTIDELINDQDAVIVALLFHGVQGKQASEIRNLTKDDVDLKNKTLRVKDDKTGEYRIVNLKDDELNTLRIIKRAYLDTEYIKKNGKMEYNEKVKDVVEMPSPKDTPYIVKTGKTQGVHYGERASQYTIYNRLEMIRSLEELSDYSGKLTTKNIVRSGMIYEAKRLLETEGGELDNDKLKRICEKYNVKNYWAVRDFINMSVLESLYGKVTCAVTAK